MIKLYMSELNWALWMVTPDGKVYVGWDNGKWERSGLDLGEFDSQHFTLVGTF